MWSNYKHHSTIKFLIGISPQGTISYLSECAGGRMSDKEIVENSTLVNFLLPGKWIIAYFLYYILRVVYFFILYIIGGCYIGRQGFYLSGSYWNVYG